MASPLQSTIAKAVHRGMKGMFMPVTYRSTASGNIQVQTAAATGATTISLKLPSDWTGVQPGDTFKIGASATNYTVSNSVSAVSGVATGVIFTPALTTSASDGGSGSINRVGIYSARAIESTVSIFVERNANVLAGDREISILARSLPIRPKPGDTVTTRSGVSVSVASVGVDEAEALWVLQCH